MTAQPRHTQTNTISNISSPHPSWLAEARFYEIYPQSFADSNGDGIGDIPGIIGKLDYINDLGCNALWINPCFDSPFKDAGYDVRDYTRVAERYGTNDDLVALFAAAHERGMHVLLDLVPGHTSEAHEWFRASCHPDPAARTLSDGENVSERYIWTDSWIAGGDGLPFIGGEAERDGTYILNFFKCQPALNYGFAHPKYPWQKPALGPDALATCEAMLNAMRFWLSRGADGFRVDMADSLVKHDDDGKPFTIRTWQYLFSKIRPEFPDAAFVSEWGRPHESMQAGFDMDFYLDWRWDGNPNGYNMLLRNTDTPLVHENDASYFNADSGTSITPFLDQYLPQLRDAERAGGLFDLITCNHDTLRTAQRLTERELQVAYGMLFTMPGCPFLYYGDEIGMHYRPLPTKEGGYVRTGSRTPMQWDAKTPNLGFSAAANAKALYLPVEPGGAVSGGAVPGGAVPGGAVSGGTVPGGAVPGGAVPGGAVSGGTVPPTVAEATARPDSLWHWIQLVLKLRAEHPALGSYAAFDVAAAPSDGRAFAYVRSAANESESLLIAMNPGRDEETIDVPAAFASDATVLASLGRESSPDVCVTASGASLLLPPQSFVILKAA
ncbi:alpha-amylase family glycosyl hydrolase [Bifidobacterium scaligerum]|uniref:Alpha-amylase n=1 Tax=Bifidobacterium scaligerum TaxID=2052656 RepID=A0A2M9HNM0_9BIFI|nr:alpha-amylase family glycosyl hydrolase [Bifidobacterium scaligerum]PJM78405.1 alpha-amylase [Bifidobacterium scaligerum]